MKLRNLERRQMVWLILLILYIGVIYSRSMKPAVQSSQESGAVLEAAIELLNHAGLHSWLTEHIVRKTTAILWNMQVWAYCFLEILPV